MRIACFVRNAVQYHLSGSGVLKVFFDSRCILLHVWYGEALINATHGIPEPLVICKDMLLNYKRKSLSQCFTCIMARICLLFTIFGVNVCRQIEWLIDICLHTHILQTASVHNNFPIPYIQEQNVMYWRWERPKLQCISTWFHSLIWPHIFYYATTIFADT